MGNLVSETRFCDFCGEVRFGLRDELSLCRIHFNNWRRTGDPLNFEGATAPRGSGTLKPSGYRFLNGRREHHVVMEEFLGRSLRSNENVHHRNGDRADNRVSNLELWVVRQPPGQRVEDKVAHALEILNLYGAEVPTQDRLVTTPVDSQQFLESLASNYNLLRTWDHLSQVQSSTTSELATLLGISVSGVRVLVNKQPNLFKRVPREKTDPHRILRLKLIEGALRPEPSLKGRVRKGYLLLKYKGRERPAHRLVMERHLGRKLHPHETIHHRNGDRLDNRVQNLELWSHAQPKGQRVQDLVEWAKEVLQLYGGHKAAA